MRVDVILLTYGEPPSTSFFDQWEYSNNILYKLTRLVAPIPKFVVPLLGAWRGHIRKKTWKEEEYSSPLEEITQNQADALHKEVTTQNSDHDWHVHIAYEFRTPTLDRILTDLSTSTDRIVLVPMYVAISDFTTGISQRDFQQFQKTHNHSLPEAKMVTFRECHMDLAHLMANFIRQQVSSLEISEDSQKRCGLLLGCHGTVIEAPKGIEDTGYCDTKQLYDDLEKLLQDEFQSVAIGWLNHRLGGEWTTPTLETSAQKMIDDQVEQIIYFPFGFIADNAETQLEGRVALRDLGIENYYHLPCVNDDNSFIQFLTQRIIVETEKPSPVEA
jgi:ferrochelatase